METALPRLASDHLATSEDAFFDRAPVSGEALAYLQYTSGSTSSPKGVMVSHANLGANLESIRKAWGYDSSSVAVMWVPNFHDDGLVHGILQPIWTGFTSHLLSPQAIVEKPARWLSTITQARATHSGGPNFAYNLCLNRISAEERQELELSSWKVAYNAAEPIRAETLEAFEATFGPHGFRPDAFFPSFGLAEATLLVTTKAAASRTILSVETGTLDDRGRAVPATTASGAKRLVGCGPVVEGTELVIADPVTARRCEAGAVGEIWIAGQTVSGGYWEQPAATRESFGATLAEDPAPGRFLRTGDLGFLWNGELFVTGRIKDLIILRGRNLYPQDLELTIEKLGSPLRAGCGATFSADLDGEERLIVVHEVDDRSPIDIDAVAARICQAVSEQHDVQVHRLVLIRPRTLPKTSSGKVQRRACREEWRAGRLDEVATWSVGQAGGTRAATPSADEVELPVLEVADDLCEWIRVWATQRVNSRLIDERRSIPAAVLFDLAERGFFGLLIPRNQGGIGLSHLGAAKVLAQLGAVDLTLGCLLCGHNSLGTRPLTRYAPEALRNEHLPYLVRGRAFAAFALTEPGAGSNVRAVTARAIPDGVGWRLYGHKVWIGSASWARVIHVFAHVPSTDTEAGGLTAFSVSAGTPGLHIGPEALTMGLRGMVQCEIVLDGASVRRENVLGRIGDGMAVAEDAIVFTRFFLAAVAAGGMKRCLQLMLRYATRREISTGRLIDHPVSRSRLGETAAATAAIDRLIEILGARLDRGEMPPREVITALKVASSEALFEAADDLMQLLGGRGYIETNMAPQLLRDARIFRIFEGPTEVLTEYLGSSLVQGNMELAGFLDEIAPAAGLGGSLMEAAQTIRERVASRWTPDQPVEALRWTYQLCGQLGTTALLAAALETTASPLKDRAQAWAKRKWAEQLERACSGDSAEAARLSATDAAVLGDELRLQIGEVEQLAEGEQAERDAFLRLMPVGTEAARDAMPATPLAARQGAAPRRGRNAPEIRTWILDWLAGRTGLSGSQMDPHQPFSTLGLDSVTGIQMAHDLGEWLGITVDTTVAWDFPTPARLAGFLAGEASPATTADSDLAKILAEIEVLSPEQARHALGALREGNTRD